MTMVENLPLSEDDQQPVDIAVGKSALLPDPRIFVDIFRRRMWVFLTLFALVLGSAIAYAKLAPRTYESVASVLIEPRRSDPVQPTATDSEDKAPTSDFIDTQIVILDSPQLAERIVQKLGLMNDSEFVPAGSAETDNQRLVVAAQSLRDASIIRRIGSTAVIEVVVRSHSAQRAAQIANRYVEQYLLNIDIDRTVADDKSNSQIDSRVNILQQNAVAADAALQHYKIAHGLMSSEGATMAEQETSTLNQQIAQARADLAERQGRLSAARVQLAHGGGGGDVTSALNSGTIGALRQQEAESSRNLAQLRSRYGPKHPAVAQEEQKLADAHRQIQLEIDRVMTSLEGEVRVASTRLSSLMVSQSQSRSRLADNASALRGCDVCSA